MSIMEFFDELADKFRIRTWPEADRRRLFRILLEIYHADGVFSDDERADFNRKLVGMDLNREEVQQTDFGEAIVTLQEDQKKMELVRFWAATALFADNDYDQIEREFIDKIITKYWLKEEDMKAVVNNVRDKKIDRAINEWYLSIKHLLE